MKGKESHLEPVWRVWYNQRLTQSVKWDAFPRGAWEREQILRSGVTVARLALNQLVKVQILAPQLKCDPTGLGYGIKRIRPAIVPTSADAAKTLASGRMWRK